METTNVRDIEVGEGVTIRLYRVRCGEAVSTVSGQGESLSIIPHAIEAGFHSGAFLRARVHATTPDGGTFLGEYAPEDIPEWLRSFTDPAKTA